MAGKESVTVHVEVKDHHRCQKQTQQKPVWLTARLWLLRPWWWQQKKSPRKKSASEPVKQPVNQQNSWSNMCHPLTINQKTRPDESARYHPVTHAVICWICDRQWQADRDGLKYLRVPRVLLPRNNVTFLRPLLFMQAWDDGSCRNVVCEGLETICLTCSVATLCLSVDVQTKNSSGAVWSFT